MSQADGSRQIKIARNSYSFGHLPMVIGIIGISLGLKKVLSYVGGADGHDLDDALYGVPMFSLYGGAVLFLLSLIFFKWYAVRSITVPRVVASIVLLALLPVAIAIPALAALGLLTAVLVALIAFETTHFAQPRDEIRHRSSH